MELILLITDIKLLLNFRMTIVLIQLLDVKIYIDCKNLNHTIEGKSRVKHEVHIMSGKHFLHHILKGIEVNIIRYLRRAVQTIHQ